MTIRLKSKLDRETFLADLRKLGSNPIIDVFDQLAIAYSEPTRHYSLDLL
jgi:predicted metal-dependent HD superfamily phosphohydrolase